MHGTAGERRVEPVVMGAIFVARPIMDQLEPFAILDRPADQLGDTVLDAGDEIGLATGKAGEAAAPRLVHHVAAAVGVDHRDGAQLFLASSMKAAHSSGLSMSSITATRGLS